MQVEPLILSLETDFMFRKREREWSAHIYMYGNNIATKKLKTNMAKKRKRDWMAKWLMLLGFMDLRRPRVSQRSLIIGLVFICCWCCFFPLLLRLKWYFIFANYHYTLIFHGYSIHAVYMNDIISTVVHASLIKSVTLACLVCLHEITTGDVVRSQSSKNQTSQMIIQFLYKNAPTLIITRVAYLFLCGSRVFANRWRVRRELACLVAGVILLNITPIRYRITE